MSRTSAGKREEGTRRKQARSLGSRNLLCDAVTSSPQVDGEHHTQTHTGKYLDITVKIEDSGDCMLIGWLLINGGREQREVFEEALGRLSSVSFSPRLLCSEEGFALSSLA